MPYLSMVISLVLLYVGFRISFRRSLERANMEVTDVF